MKNKKILITGSAGFIGYHLCKSLLKDNVEILGLDNLNEYYDVKLKLSRLDKLRKYENFLFEKIDIADRETLTKVFNNFKSDIVVNLAAQAGVRYSIKNPYAYMECNLVGFLNIIELCRNNNIEGLIYASSSSVYGSNKKIPFSEKDRVEKPISLYAASKRANELIAYTYYHLYGIRSTGLRFFTVYGPWGRPDMSYFIFAKNISEGKKIKLFNNGKIKRDFTYIDDIVSGIRSAIMKNYRNEIFNLGNNNSENLMDMVKIIEQELKVKAKISYEKIQPGDPLKTMANIKKSKEKLHYDPKIKIAEGLPIFINWFRDYFNN